MAIRIPWVGKPSRLRVAIVGDLMLDEYLTGEVVKISPEAPVPVHLVSKSTVVPGGAANAARNIQLVGGQAVLFGVVGDDSAANTLLSILTGDGVDVGNVMKDRNRPTVKKTRVTAGNHQLIRIDWEKVAPIEASYQTALIDGMRGAEFDAILLSDYGKGALPAEFTRAVIRLAREKNIPCVVDPKGRDFSKYAGAHTVKPNRKEAMESLDMDQTEKVRADELANRLRSHWGLENVLITLGAEGMIFAGSAGKEPVMRLPSKAREVFDVSGAGDCVAAIYTLALAAGDEVYHAMQLANVAAGVVVERWGTHPVSLAELQDALSEEDVDSHQSRNIDTSRKIMTEEQVLANVGPRLQRKVKMVFTNGCFDVLHAGHVTYLEAARALGDLLVVGVNSDASIRRIKGPKRPILEEHLRMRTLAALAAVDYVVKFSGDTPEPLIQALSPNVLVKGADWNPDSIAGADHVKSYGGLVTTVELVPGISTSEIVDRIKRQK